MLELVNSIALWILWKQRCRQVFSNQTLHQVVLLQEIWSEVVATLKSQYDDLTGGSDGVERKSCPRKIIILRFNNRTRKNMRCYFPQQKYFRIKSCVSNEMINAKASINFKVGVVHFVLNFCVKWIEDVEDNTFVKCGLHNLEKDMKRIQELILQSRESCES